METQQRAVTLNEPRPEPTLAGLRNGLDRWDRRLGGAYARLTNHRLARTAGRLLAALLLAVLMVSKGFAVARLVGAGRPDAATWTVALDQLLQIPFLALSVMLVIARGPARSGTARFTGIAAALGGSFAASLLVLQGNGDHSPVLVTPAVLLLLAGMGWAIWSMVVLGRCFSMLPEVRGLVTSGPYRWVRHPVYLGELTAVLGLLLPILSARNVAVFALFCALQLWRTRHEEAGLAAAFPEYVDYRRRTARLLPGLW